MHDGSLRDLKQVMDFYIGGGNSHPNLDKEIHTLDFLTGEERRDLSAFLNSLTGEMPPKSRSGRAELSAREQRTIVCLPGNEESIGELIRPSRCLAVNSTR